MNHQWMYIDFNSYFASVEQQCTPRLRNKAIAVVPVDTDATCVIAASYEAKALGIKTGTPVWQAKKLCPHLICILANHEVYVEYHEKIIREINRFVPIAKVCSIDEVACELLENERAAARALAQKVKQGLRENVGECIRCSIGIAPNCYLAKTATDMQKPDGLVCIHLEDLPHKLYSLQLRDLVGIGANRERHLKRAGIANMQILCSLDLSEMRRAWGSVEGERMWYHLRGIPLPERKTERTSLGHSHVLAPELRTPETARWVGRKLVAKAACRLRATGMVASKVSLSIKLEKGECYTTYLLCNQIDDSITFLSLFQKMWEKIAPQHHRIKKIAVTFSDLEEENQQQYKLFTDPVQEKERKISYTVDLINQKYGKNSLTFGL